MANFVTGDLDMVDQLIYGNGTHVPEEYLRQQQDQFMSNAMSGSMDFFQAAWDYEARLRQSRAVQMAKAATRKVRSLWQSNEIRRLMNVGELQHAPVVMQPYIMAEPETRRMWQNQMCDGYDDVVTLEVDEVDEQVVEYRQVMNGIVVDTPSDDEEADFEWEAVSYFDDEYLDESQKINVEDQFDILNTWALQRRLLITGGEDFTSATNGRLENESS